MEISNLGQRYFFQWICIGLYIFAVEYCASRAVPNVSLSEYLNTIGSKLLPGVDILWTGMWALLKCILKKNQPNNTTFIITWNIQLEVMLSFRRYIMPQTLSFRSKGNFQTHQCSVRRGTDSSVEATSCTVGQHPRQWLWSEAPFPGSIWRPINRSYSTSKRCAHQSQLRIRSELHRFPHFVSVVPVQYWWN